MSFTRSDNNVGEKGRGREGREEEGDRIMTKTSIVSLGWKGRKRKRKFIFISNLSASVEICPSTKIRN